MRLFLQRGWRNQVPNVLLRELRSIQGMNFKGVIVCFNRKFNNFDHSCHWFLDHFRNRLIVEDGLHEIRVVNGAKAKQYDVAEQLRVISLWIIDETMFARLEHRLI